jgi:hypothetical protein
MDRLKAFGHIHTNNAPVVAIFWKEMVWTRRDGEPVEAEPQTTAPHTVVIRQDRTVDHSLISIRRIMMSMYARDLLELRRDDPASTELRKMAMNIIAVGTRDQREGC